MKKEDTYLKSLMQELPTEKAPEGITQLIMQKIQTKKAVMLPMESLKIWQMQAFYIMIGIVLAEGWLFWSLRDWLTLVHFETLLKNVYIQVNQYFAINNFSTLFMGIVLAGILVYLFVRSRIESTKCHIGVV